MGFVNLGVAEAVEMSKNLSNKNTKVTGNEKVGNEDISLETKTARPTRTPRKAGDVRGVKKIMGYPLARGPRDDTGDALVIKCIEYQPPKTGLEASTTRGFALKDGVAFGGEQKIGTTIKEYDKKGNVLGDKKFIDKVKITNDGASDRQKSSTAIYYITLPIPQDVNDSNVVTWGDDSMNIFQLAAVGAAAGLLNDTAGTFQEAKALLDAGIGRSIGAEIGGQSGQDTQKAITSAIAGEAINRLGGNIRPNSVLGRSTGVILNSNLELLFSGVTLRTFPFSINFSPRNSNESKEVLSIIKALKSSMAAKKNASQGQGGIFLRAPDVFQLRYLHNGKDHPFLNRIKDCALTGMTVNYTNSGTYATYDDGTPVSIRMNLTFKELNPIYFEDYEGDVGGVGY